jgi:signal transduction histidine kinase
VTALLYFLVSVEAIGLATRAWLADRRAPVRQAFLLLGTILGLAYASFALSLLPGLEVLRLGFMVGGGLAPAATLAVVDRIVARDDQPRSRYALPLWTASAVIVPSLTALHAARWLDTPRSSPAEVVLGLLAFAAFGLVFQRLRDGAGPDALPVERTRLRSLAALIALAVGSAALEQLARGIGAPVDPGHLSLASRGVALQGAIPPFSAVFTALALLLMHGSVISYRLVDLNEVSARLAALGLSAGILILVDSLTFLWVDTFTAYPFHSTFQLFLTSLVFLAAYEPIAEQVRRFTNRVFNRRGQVLAETLDHLIAELPGLLTVDGLVDRVLGGLHASGRASRASVYLWDPRLEVFRCAGHRGAAEDPPPGILAAQPFSGGFARGVAAYERHDLIRRGVADVAEILDAMGADLAIPLRAGDHVLGWLALRDEAWSDGYSADEIARLATLAERCRLVLTNAREIAALEQRRRLAAMGEMAAGLAHEIRNPLAGLKGAAQFLQTEEVGPDGREMLQVIVDEANRLDVVVGNFLDYARPLQLVRASASINQLVSHALGLLRAQGLPARIVATESLAPDLPPIQVDATRVAQVLINLLQNAVQAMPNGGVLTTTTRLRDDWLEIAVTDTGTGLSQESLTKLFVPFYTTRAGGTGLGLAISRRLVDAHGGEIVVSSEPGRGATFVVRLPVLPA